MKFEHLALNVPDSRAMAQWYADHLKLKIIRSADEAPYGRFLADDTGRPVLELYSNPSPPYPDYASMHPLTLHVAFVATDTKATAKALEKAGAKLVSLNDLPDGTVMGMLRDPWGVCIQFCQRATPF